MMSDTQHVPPESPENQQFNEEPPPATKVVDPSKVKADDVPPEDEVVQRGDPYFALEETQSGRWIWTLWAANGRAMAQSPVSYKRRNDAQRAIAQVQADIPAAEVLVVV